MPSNEDLYGEIRREEEEAANLYRRPAQDKPRPLVNESAARERYMKEIAPVIERRRRAEAGLPITDSPIKNFMLRLLHKDKLPEPVVIVDPNQGIAVQVGKTEEEVRQAIIAKPDEFADLKKKAPEVRPVQASRKRPTDLHQ